VLSNELEHCLNSAFHQAREARSQYLTVEHLLLAILGSPETGEILGACGANPTQLKQDLQDHLDRLTPRLEQSDKGEVPPQPTIGFQGVLQRAVFYVQSSGRKLVGVGEVLVAIFSEKQSHAVSLLNRQHVTRLDVVNYRSHGLSKASYEKAGDDDKENGVESEYDSDPAPSKSERGWDREQSEKLRATMSVADIEVLMQRSQRDPKSLSIDEVGVLFLVTRERIRAIEARLKNDSATNDNKDD
jgi:ATP-dependent Clp protease ATP-binding subunit ClpA